MTHADAIRVTATRFRQLSSELQRVERNAGRRAARALRQAALDRFTATGFGRAVFKSKAPVGGKGARSKALRVVFPMPRVSSPAEGHLEILFELHGIAALVQKGGRTEPHEIVASQGVRDRVRDVLAFIVKGQQRFGPRVHHPGSRIPRQPFLEAAGEDARRVLEAELERGYAAAAGKV